MSENALVAEGSVIALLNKSEIDQQIATAHAYPRSLQKFRNEAMDMVTLTEAIAGECIYSLPRDGKTIEGPTARFAEVMVSAWGNCRAGARIVNEGSEFVTAQGVFHDLQRNVAITYEVQRRIVGKNGRRFSPDMIGVTANAACSIALRNAILKGIPKAFWADMYAAARQTVMGDFQTLANRRDEAMKVFQSYGVKPEQVFALLNVKGIEDIALEHLVQLRGTVSAIREGEATVEEIFARTSPRPPAPPAPNGSAQGGGKPAGPPPPPKPMNPNDPTPAEVTPPAPTVIEAPATQPKDYPDYGRKPEEFLAFIEKKAGEAKDIDALNEVWVTYVEALDHKNVDVFPSDRTELGEIYGKHQNRIEAEG